VDGDKKALALIQQQGAANLWARGQPGPGDER
jgi:hypothetical protein